MFAEGASVVTTTTKIRDLLL